MRKSQIMQLSIPIDSLPLLLAAIIAGMGVLVTPISARIGIICIGMGTIIMGAVVLATAPIGQGSILSWLVPFGFTIVVGGWMMMIGLKHPS
jgi:hypothetical protein